MVRHGHDDGGYGLSCMASCDRHSIIARNSETHCFPSFLPTTSIYLQLLFSSLCHRVWNSPLAAALPLPPRCSSIRPRIPPIVIRTVLRLSQTENSLFSLSESVIFRTESPEADPSRRPHFQLKRSDYDAVGE